MKLLVVRGGDLHPRRSGRASMPEENGEGKKEERTFVLASEKINVFWRRKKGKDSKQDLKKNFSPRRKREGVHFASGGEGKSQNSLPRI